MSSIPNVKRYRITSPDGRQKYADAVVKGVVAFLQTLLE